MNVRLRFAPWLALLLTAPVIGELLSSSAPPAEFFSVMTLVFFIPLYGGGALICRELAVRWGKGWLGLLLLGAAYGVWEEGIVCMSFFNPGWMDLGPLAARDHWLGVNWVWTFGLTAFHSLVSVGLSVALVTVFTPPELRNRPWLSTKALKAAVPLFLLHGLGLAAFIAVHAAFVAPWTHLLACAVAMALLIGLAYRLPGPAPSSDETPARVRTWRLAGWGLSAMLLFYLWLYVPAAMGLHRAAILALGAALLGFFGWRIRRLTDKGRRLDPRRLYAAAAGGLSVMALFCVLAETDPDRADNTAGLALTGVLTWALLALGAWRITGPGARNQGAPLPAPNRSAAP